MSVEMLVWCLVASWSWRRARVLDNRAEAAAERLIGFPPAVLDRRASLAPLLLSTTAVGHIGFTAYAILQAVACALAPGQ